MSHLTYFGDEMPRVTMEHTSSVVRVRVLGTGQTLVFKDLINALDYIPRNNAVNYIGDSSILRECKWDDECSFADYIDALDAYARSADIDGNADEQWTAIDEINAARRRYCLTAEPRGVPPVFERR